MKYVYIYIGITLAIISYTLCYFLVDNGVDVPALLQKIGISVSGSSSTATAAGTRTPRRRSVVVHGVVGGGGQRMDPGQNDIEQIPPRHPVALGLAVIGRLLDGPHLMAEIGQDGLVVLVGPRARGAGR